MQAVGFLHDLGSLQHFHNEHLKSKVVINPQWIVDVMSCVVSVHNTPIQVSTGQGCSHGGVEWVVRSTLYVPIQLNYL